MSTHVPRKAVTPAAVLARKGREPLVCLTAYTTPMARLVDAHADVILVGDSLGMVVHGLPSTVGVTTEMMILHGQAVRRGTSNALLVVDMPFGSYEAGPARAFETAARIMTETGCAAVKLEGGETMAETTKVKAICCFSHSGTTALLAARERPRVPIIALTPKVDTARRLALSWGLHCVVVPEVDRFKLAVVNAARVAREHGFASLDDRIVVTAGIPFGVAGSTNILRVATANERAIYEGGGED